MKELSRQTKRLTSERQGQFGIKYADPDYELPNKKLRGLETTLVEKIARRLPHEGIGVAWMTPHDPYSNVIRTYEARMFSEAADFPESAEENTLLLALADTRPDVRRVIHGATIMGPSINPNRDELAEMPEESQSSTGFYTIDGLVRLRGNFTAEEFREYHEAMDIDLTNCISVESNFRIGERVEPYLGIDSATLAYLAMFKYITGEVDPSQKNVAVFASINQPSIDSFRRVGIKCDYLMGRDDLKTPEAELGEDYYKPVIIPADEDNRRLFEAIRIDLPEFLF